MKRTLWMKWVAMLAAGAAVLQTASCVETAQVVDGAASLVTAGGVLYIVTRIIRE